MENANYRCNLENVKVLIASFFIFLMAFQRMEAHWVIIGSVGALRLHAAAAAAAAAAATTAAAATLL